MLALGGVDQWVNEVCNHGVRISPSTGPPATETIERGQLIIEPWFDDPMTRSERRIANDTDPVHAKRSNSAIQTSLLYCVEAIRAFLHMQRDSAVTIAAAAENLKERTIEKPRVFSAQCLPASVDLSERNG